MTHTPNKPSSLDERVFDYLYGDLSQSDRAALAREIESDGHLKQQLDDVRALLSAVDSLNIPEPPDSATQAIQMEARRMEQERKQGRKPLSLGWSDRLKTLLWRPELGIGLAAMLVVAVGLYMAKEARKPDYRPENRERIQEETRLPKKNEAAEQTEKRNSIEALRGKEPRKPEERSRFTRTLADESVEDEVEHKPGQSPSEPEASTTATDDVSLPAFKEALEGPPAKKEAASPRDVLGGAGVKAEGLLGSEDGVGATGAVGGGIAEKSLEESKKATKKKRSSKQSADTSGASKKKPRKVRKRGISSRLKSKEDLGGSFEGNRYYKQDGADGATAAPEKTKAEPAETAKAEETVPAELKSKDSSQFDRNTDGSQDSPEPVGPAKGAGELNKAQQLTDEEMAVAEDSVQKESVKFAEAEERESEVKSSDASAPSREVSRKSVVPVSTGAVDDDRAEKNAALDFSDSDKEVAEEAPAMANSSAEMAQSEVQAKTAKPTCVDRWKSIQGALVQKRWKEALALLDAWEASACKAGQPERNRKTARAEALMGVGQKQQAEVLLKDVLKEDPEPPKARMLMEDIQE